jgi:hypothetical protein
VDHLKDLDRAFLDRADVEVFAQSRLDGPDADFYRSRIDRVPWSQVQILGERPFVSRGEPMVIVRHVWEADGAPQELRVRRPDEAPYLVGRLPEGLVRPGDTVSLVLWVPREATDLELSELRLDPGGRPVRMFDTGRRLSRFFSTSPRFAITGEEVRVRIPTRPEDRPRGFGLEVHRWRPAPSPAQ